MTTINTIISDALIDLGRLSASETAEPLDLVHGLRVANRLFGRWAAKNLLIPYTTTESFAGTGSASYTMGAAGTASATRALSIESAYSSTGSYDYPIMPINQNQYNRISNKTQDGRPSYLFYDPVYPISSIYLWPAPSASYTIYIESIKQLHASLTLGDTVALSPEYEDFVVIGLRNRLAGSFGLPVTQYMVKEYMDAENDIRVLNSTNRYMTMDMPGMFSGRGVGYNIDEDM